MKTVLLDAVAFVGNDPYLASRLAVVSIGVTIAIVQKLLYDASIWDYISSLLENPYFGATFSVVGIGALLAALQQFYSLGQHFYSVHWTCSMEIPSTDESYQAVLQWIYCTRLENTLHFSVETKSSTENALTSGNNSAGRTKFNFLPSPGTHNFMYNGKWIRLARNKKSSDGAFFQAAESLVLSTSGRDTRVFKRILSEAIDFAQSTTNGKTIIYRASNGTWAGMPRPVQKRPLQSVVLDEGVADKIFEDFDHFLNHADWYVTRGIPYRRGYLLHGPPGTGKTSFIMALAGAFDKNICLLNLSEKWLTDDIFQQLLASAPQDSVFLLEDVDAAFLKRDVSRSEVSSDIKNVAFDGLSRLTFSGFLNAIDGVASAEGRVLFMTTNHIDKLDHALLRPGRVDMCQHLGYASLYQLRTIYSRFYPQEPEKSAQKFAELVLDTAPNVTIAQIQGLFLRHKYDPKNILKDLSLSLLNPLDVDLK